MLIKWNNIKIRMSPSVNQTVSIRKKRMRMNRMVKLLQWMLWMYKLVPVPLQCILIHCLCSNASRWV